MYSPCLPLLERSMAKALEKGKVIISPKVIRSMPITNNPVQVPNVRKRKLRVVSTSPRIIREILDKAEDSRYLINGISKAKMIKPFMASSKPMAGSLMDLISL